MPAPRDPLLLAASAEGRAARAAALQPSAPIRVGLLINGAAGQMRARAQRAALERVASRNGGSDCVCIATPDLASVRRALAELLVVHRCNVLATAGGDGTLHHAVNALSALDASQPETQLWPRWLVLSGGTLNIVARTLGSHGSPAKRLAAFLNDFAGVRLSRLPVRRVSLLSAAWQGEAQRLGFVFGSEAAFHAIALYTRFGSGYLGLARFLAEFARGATVGSALWRAEGWKLGPYLGPLHIDGTAITPYTGAVASTVDLTLAIAAVRTIRRQLLQPGMSVRVVEETDLQRLVGLLPAMMRDQPAVGLRDWPVAQQLQLTGPFTLDGELYPLPGTLGAHVPLTVRVADQRLHAVPGEWARADEPGLL